uniref:Uncharacterized protein n=1 Tax=Aplanochytrium stocchinoi TaxID=215587 RepID=A0A7S3PFA4_9STRA|mmetsp:Transcript_11655/g.14535  ORF Transcript_11655/g.14535 Transcript_11655/m.14535 type:complete len:118 (+) Transcript_11655:162-515(+)
MRISEQQRRQRLAERRRNKIKNDIILKALQEASDLDALRAEKRLIIEEERRLKALLGVEKTNSKKKQDLMAAMRAETHRRQMKHEHRRSQRVAFEEEIQQKSRLALLEKHGLTGRYS